MNKMVLSARYRLSDRANPKSQGIPLAIVQPPSLAGVFLVMGNFTTWRWKLLELLFYASPFILAALIYLVVRFFRRNKGHDEK
jgi:hypothetical protein